MATTEVLRFWNDLSEDVKTENRTLARNLKDKFDRTKQERNSLEQDIPDINRYIRPMTPKLYNKPSTTGINDWAKTNKIYDTAGLEANLDFAAQMKSYVVSEMEKWFQIGRIDIDDEEMDPMQREARAKIERIAMRYFARPNSGFSSAAHEYFIDLGAYGNSVITGDYSKSRKCNVYRSHPFINTYFVEDAEGIVSTMMMVYSYRADQLKDLHRLLPGGLNVLPEILRTAKDEDKFDVVKCVFPRAVRNNIKGGLADRKNKPIAMVLLMPDQDTVIYEGGMDHYQYFPGRMMKLAGETYGTGSGQLSLPIVKNVQTIVRDFMISGALNLRNPWWTEDDSITSPFDGNLVPGLMLKGQPGSKKPEPLGPSGQLEYTDTFIEMHYTKIRKLYFLDDMIRERKRERQSGYEISDERSEMLKGLSPIFGRGSDECFSNLIHWHIWSLIDNGHIPADLVQAMGITRENMCVTFVGPITKMFKAMRTANTQAFLQDAAQIIPNVPEAGDGIAFAKLLRLQASNRDVEDIAFLSDDEQKAKTQRREEQAAALAQAQAAQQVTSSMKNIADAQQKGLGVF